MIGTNMSTMKPNARGEGQMGMSNGRSCSEGMVVVLQIDGCKRGGCLLAQLFCGCLCACCST